MPPRKSFKELRSQADVEQYITRLNTEWPQRSEIIQFIVDQVNALPAANLHVVELCCGAGLLAEALLLQIPRLSYTGLDFSEPLLASARSRLASFGKRASLMQNNLNEDDWLSQIPEKAQAVVSMQSLHDLGDESKVDRIYGLGLQLLDGGGLFINADLTVPPEQDNPNNPGRRSIPRHLDLLQQRGYQAVTCGLARGEFGCLVGYKANPGR